MTVIAVVIEQMLAALDLAIVGSEFRDIDGNDLGDCVQGPRSLGIQSEYEEDPPSVAIRHAHPTGLAHGAFDGWVPSPPHEDRHVLSAIDPIGDRRGGNRASAVEAPQLLAGVRVVGSEVSIGLA